MVGIVIVSHSKKLAEGVKELVEQMVSERINMEVVGGISRAPGKLGTDPLKVKEVIAKVMDNDGVLIFGDLGSAILGSKAAIKMLPQDIREKVVIVNAPLVEGVFAAAVELSVGGKLEEAKRAAEESRNLLKI